MIKSIPFCKMQTLGNDFVVLDRIDSSFYIDQAFVKSIGSRKFGIGFDQLLVLEAPFTPEHDFSFQVFNANGASANHCLNGARALISYIISQNIIGSSPIRLEIGDQSLEGEQISSTVIKMKLLNPIDSYQINSITLPGTDFIIKEVICGNKHIVIWNCKNKDKNKALSLLKSHNYTFEHYNISFAYSSDQKISLETIERGVGKTLSCGSAALSAYLSYPENLSGHWQDLRIETSSGYITMGNDDGTIFIIGPTHRVFSGNFTVRYKTMDKRNSHDATEK